MEKNLLEVKKSLENSKLTIYYYTLKKCLKLKLILILVIIISFKYLLKKTLTMKKLKCRYSKFNNLRRIRLLKLYQKVIFTLNKKKFRIYSRRILTKLIYY